MIILATAFHYCRELYIKAWEDGYTASVQYKVVDPSGAPHYEAILHAAKAAVEYFNEERHRPGDTGEVEVHIYTTDIYAARVCSGEADVEITEMEQNFLSLFETETRRLPGELLIHWVPTELIDWERVTDE